MSNRAVVMGTVVLIGICVALGVVVLRFAHERDGVSRELAASKLHNATLVRQVSSVQRTAGQLTSELLHVKRTMKTEQSCAHSMDGPGPHAVLVPDHGPVGTRVSIVLDCLKPDFTAAIRGAITYGGYGVFLIRDFAPAGSCELLAGGAYHLRLVGHGRAAGWFTVSRQGDCFQSSRTRLVTPGLYGVGVSCHACEVTTFVVTRS